MAIIRRAALVLPRAAPRLLDPGEPVNQGLVGYWSMDRGTVFGTTLADLSGKGNGGTLVGSPPLVTGLFGQALSFNGTSQWVAIPESPSTDWTTGFTICAWINLADITGFPYFFNKNAVGGGFLGIWLGNPSGVFYMPRGGNYSALSFPSGTAVGVWRHFVFTYDSVKGAVVYANGVQVASDGTLTGNLDVVPGTTYLMSYQAGTLGANGSASQFRLYNRALPAAEVYRIYADTSGTLGWITPVRTRLFVPAAGLATRIGTLAQTQADQTSVIAGSVSDRGTLAQTEADQTSVIAGSVSDRGTLAQTEADQTSTIAGSVLDRATLVETQADQTAALAGSVADRAALAQTQADETSAVTGSVSDRAAVSQTEADQTSVIAGSISDRAALAQTQPDQTATVAGSVGDRGALSQTEADQTAVIAGTVGLATIHGALAQTQADETTAITGSVVDRAALAQTGADQSAVLTGSTLARVFTAPPSAFRTVTLNASSRTVKAGASDRTIIIPRSSRTVKSP